MTNPEYPDWEEIRRLREDAQRLDWYAANPDRAYRDVYGKFYLRPLRSDGSVSFTDNPYALGADKIIGPFNTLREAIDAARAPREEEKA